MKKLGILLAAAAASAGITVAQDSEVVFDLDAQVSEVCGAWSWRANPISLDFGDLAQVETTDTVTTPGRSVSYVCNSPTGFTRTISSTAGGVLVRDGSSGGNGNEIPYTMSHGGGSAIGLTNVSLTSPIVTNLGPSPAFLSGQTGTVTFTVNGVLVSGDTNVNEADRTTVFAGDYGDIVTISTAAI